MLVEVTYACKMGCTHCLSDCKPDVDWISRQWTVDKLPKDYRSFKKEIEEKLTMLIKHARSITLKRKQYSLQEKILDDVKIW